MDTRDYPKAQALIARIDAAGLSAGTASLKGAAPDSKSDAYPAFRAMLVNAAAKLRQRGRFADGAALYRILTTLSAQAAEAFGQVLGRNPDAERRDFARSVLALATEAVRYTTAIAQRANDWRAAGVGLLDALHLATAEAAGAEVFVTADDRLRQIELFAAEVVPAVQEQVASAREKSSAT